MGGVRVDQLRAVPQQQLLELVGIGPRDVPANQPGAGVAKRLDRAQVAGPVDDDRVARIDEASRQQVQPLLRAREHEDVLRLAAKTVCERGAERR
jgi:hypothetical protein